MKRKHRIVEESLLAPCKPCVHGQEIVQGGQGELLRTFTVCSICRRIYKVVVTISAFEKFGLAACEVDAKVFYSRELDVIKHGLESICGASFRPMMAHHDGETVH